MAGKKKKPAANPARGFATTSVASKTSIQTDDKADEQKPNASVSDNAAATRAEKVSTSAVEATLVPAGEREAHQLTPNELEAQLELADLQNTVDALGPIARKDSARHVARLQADRRVLRNQADFLSVSEWLPSDVVEQIVASSSDESTSSGPTDTSLPRDELLLRLWKLLLILKDVDVDEARVQKALQYVLSSKQGPDSMSSAWGLNAALQWLAIECSESMPLEYEFHKQVLVQSSTEDHLAAEVQSESKPTFKNRRADAVAGTEIKGNPPQDQIEDIVVSDTESDLDPDEMLADYLKSKSTLYERHPGLISEPSYKGAPLQKRGPTPGESRLLARLKSIEADILFDRRLAGLRWRDKKQEIQERQRLGLAIDGNPTSDRKAEPLGEIETSNGTAEVMGEADAIAKDLLKETADDDDDHLLGAMFDVPIEQGLPEPSSTADQTSITCRDFGKLTGLSARKILEDACKSRDSGATVRTRMISDTTYSSRHQVVVSWSKPQSDIDASIELPGFQFRSSSRTTIVDMISIATPDINQSEGCASTAMLFLLFSRSTKDKQLALRLPAPLRDLWQEFTSVRQEVSDAKDRDVVRQLQDMIQTQRDLDEDLDIVIRSGFRDRSQAASGLNTPNGINKLEQVTPIDPNLVELWQHKSTTAAFQRMLHTRKSLPMYQFKEAALATVRENQVTILCGETGCGKSTQMPSFILEDELSHGRRCSIYCTEPRRISAISLAQRVSEELGEGRNAVGTNRSLVGYAIRLESHTSATTKLVYATVGIVLRMLESEHGLSNITHLIIDEVHERTIDTDFLLIVLKSLVIRRPDLRVVLMSATVDAQRFSEYLGNAPIITVPGRTFPVESYFLEDAIEKTGYVPENSAPIMNESDDELDDADKDKKPQSDQALQGYSAKTLRVLSTFDEYRIDYGLVVRVLESVAYDRTFQDYSKAILVFLPGLAEIRRVNDILNGHSAFSNGWKIYPLHSEFSSEDQQAAFQVPPRGIRKIVLATNIAETGVTIPDITCVVDTGKHKEMRFDERRQLSRLIQSFISKANAKQRRGRAGRVQKGICFHLFTKSRHDNIMADQQTPEILRLSLQDLVMRVKICNLGDIEHVLGAALDPPAAKNIRRAIDALIEVNALTQGEELTPLGRQLAKLPLDAQLGKLILLGSVFGCLDFALTTAAISSSKSIFLGPIGAKRQADTVRLGFKRADSDQLTAYNAYSAWRRVCTTTAHFEFQYCKKHFLSPQNLGNVEDLKGQLLAALADAGFVSLTTDERHALSRIRANGSSYNKSRAFVTVPEAKLSAETNDLLINSVTAWSFYPKIISRDGNGWKSISNNASISLHMSSVNKLSTTPTLEQTRYLSYYSIMQSSSRFTSAQETSPVSDVPLVLLAGDAVFNLYAGVITLDGNKLRFKVRDFKTLIALQTLRKKVLDILAKTMKNPGLKLSEKQKWWWGIFVGVFDRVAESRRDRNKLL